jgi:hypothetical protein
LACWPLSPPGGGAPVLLIWAFLGKFVWPRRVPRIAHL